MHLMILDKEETLPEELLKLQEEFKEVKEAIINGDKQNTTEEILDNMQVLIGMLYTKVKTENMDLEKEINKHNRKLLKRRWEFKSKINFYINS
ncbi:nucleotide pyrophosphohydrolase [Clostridium botulinum]|uniref:Nucleotide pyrophosphohydrolase n=1 Tax=Clostridium botulinum TaxID=1491 RepID=A0A846I719_CLOBO|nr:nucleotide pyrophosphohydrolase [Clostridium botulinum]AJE10969.1 phosphoribosyl-ATP pyrophosphohydrolase family protein [Clostridium botulinum CDC_1436]AJE12533.1 phosphoribosyl-ATP pyrophosphohydrolase family protein [Clostridium botulinum CDC_1436]MBY6879737.1 nucleotide pyrophosphohydrolase [Clostridium botulinum]NEZ94200.1 nucleotide pyrophosphohydrolase [Clostridium botulinum]NFB02257.1 nucleotide pyrophosphohydrolase [Clostridium botulinum]